MFLIASAAVALRFFGETARSGDLAWPLRAIGWIAAAVAVWMGMSALGAWAPIWPALLVGACGAMLEPTAKPAPLRIGADVGLIALCSALSLPALHWGEALLAGTVILIAMTVIGRTQALLSNAVRRRLVVGGLVAGILVVMLSGYAATTLSPVNAWFMNSPTSLLHLGLCPTGDGKQIRFSNGSTAWLDRPRGDSSGNAGMGAVLFHGHHRDGSHQSTAIALRRALRDAGFTVIAVDHPGFGASPAPPANASYEAWDPLPVAVASLNMLHADPHVSHVIAVGHSMGVIDVLRLLQHGEQFDAVVLLGAGMLPHEESERRLHRSFHRERNIQHELSIETAGAIHGRFYDTDSIIRRLGKHQALTVFVTFDIEHALVMARRDEMFNLLPDPKIRWDLQRTTHYVNTSARLGIVMGDVRTAAHLSRRFSELNRQFAHAE